jgi:hypothetical protein
MSSTEDLPSCQNFPHVPLGTKITLSSQELQECIKIGQERCTKNKEEKTVNCNYSGRDDVDISVQGVISEWMFCKLFQVPVTALYDTTCRNRFNDTFDATVAGYSVDVKGPLGHDRSIWVSQGKDRNPADLYGLLTLERPNVSKHVPFSAQDEIEGCFQGFIHGEHLLVGGNIQRRGQKYIYTCPSSRLMTLEEIQKLDKNQFPRLF